VRIVPLIVLLAACPSPSDDTSETDPVDTDTDTDTDTDPCDEVPWYDDADEDGYGDASTEVLSCEGEAGQVQDGTDCDDTLAAVNPGEVEVCDDGLDNNCDGAAPECRPEGSVALVDHTTQVVDDEADEGFGSAVALVPDVDGDGRADLLIGRPYDDRYRPGNGWVGLYTGVSTLAGATPRTFFRLRSDGENLGTALVGPGDLDGDGDNDLVLAAPRVADGGSEDVGAVFLLSAPFPEGFVDLADTPGVMLRGTGRKDQAGRTLAAPGDLNGDGKADVAVGAPQPTGDKSGRVYLIPGDASAGDLESAALTEIEGGDMDQRVGEILAAVGDLDGDGVGEVVLGGGSRTGATSTLWWFSDPAEGVVSVDDADASLAGGDHVTLQQGVVDGAGDTNDDGYDDVWVGAPAIADLDDDDGAVHLFLGPLDGGWSLASADGTLTGSRARQHVGFTVSGAGDLDNDGLPDLITAAIPLSGDDEILIVYGGLSGTRSVPDATLVGEADVRRTGQALDAGLDVDGDGLPDALIGAPGFSGFGRAYLLLGGGF
jgi:hypothetical protein